ncbi:MAG: lysophospholipid acyltransferase family protein [Ignavibacteria bacterium]|nr:lysophospholipid acyltransferase family protein [Ignavibacteria bacterium]
MSKLTDWLVAEVLASVGRSSCAKTFDQRISLGRRLGRLMKVDRRRLAITRTNVVSAFPEISAADVDEIVTGAYENLGITLAELLAVPVLTPSLMLDRIQIPNIELVRDRHQRGLPSILISGHFGNWEYLAIAAGIEIGAPITVVVHPQSNKIVDGELNTYRSKFGNVLVSMHDAARTIVRTLHSGGTIAFLVDQYAHPERDPWIPFFSRLSPTYAAPAALAIRYNVPIFHAYAQRLDDGTYIAPLAQLDLNGITHDETGVVELTRRHVRALETVIKRHPHLWSWQHRRWRDYMPPSQHHDGNRYGISEIE